VTKREQGFKMVWATRRHFQRQLARGLEVALLIKPQGTSNHGVEVHGRDRGWRGASLPAFANLWHVLGEAEGEETLTKRP
jgi:hypothetical protein